MKKLLILLIIFLGVTHAQFTTPTVNGTIGTNEYGVHTDGQNQGTNGQTIYMTWDNTNLYIGISSSNTAEALVVYIDTDPITVLNGGDNSNGSISGFNYDGEKFDVLPFRADFVAYVKSSYREYRKANGSGGWSTQTAAFGSYAENSNVVEFSIPWSDITGTSRPNSFNWFGFKTSGGGFVYSQSPSENPSGSVGTTAKAQYYYTVSLTADGSSTKPFSQKSFTSDGSSANINANSLYDFTLNSSGFTLSLNGNVSVANKLALNAGFLSLGSNNLTLGANATAPISASSVNMIVTNGSGELRKTFTGNGYFNFPVGDNTGTVEYSPLNINLLGTAYSSAYVSVKVIDAKHPNNTSSTDFLSRYWTVGQSGITGFSGLITAYYLESDVNGTESSIQEAFYTGSWTLDGTVNTVSNFLNINVSSVADFTGGEASALPVELSSFTSSVSGATVQLNWATATEVDNYGFEVERSVDNVTFSKIGFVAGAGNSNVQKQYSYSDANLAAGTYYYRLKQVDTDGSYEYSQVVKSEVVGTPKEFTLSQNYPNPFNPSTAIAFALPKESNVKLSVYNMLGEEVAVLVNGVMSAGNHSVDFSATNLNSGMYVYRIEAGEFSGVRKMTLLK